MRNINKMDAAMTVKKRSIIKNPERFCDDCKGCYDEARMADKFLRVATDISESEFGLFVEKEKNGRVNVLSYSRDAGEDWEKLVRDLELSASPHPLFKGEKVGPKGFPPAKTILRIPVKQGDIFSGMVLLADREDGYEDEMRRSLDALSALFIKLFLKARKGVSVAEQPLPNGSVELMELFKLSVDMMAIVGFDGFFKYYNPAVIKNLGYTDKELKARPFIEFVHQDDREETLKEAASLQSGKKTIQFENRYKTKDGSYIWFSWNVRPDVEKELYYCSIRNVTERKEMQYMLRETEEKYRNLAENSPDWIWEVNTQGVYTYASPAAEKLLGYKAEEIVGKTPFELMSPEEAEKVGSAFISCVEQYKPIVKLENKNIHKDGHEVVLETSGVPFFDSKGELAGYRGVDRDITDRKKAEEELAKYREHLEQLVKERTVELENANKELESFAYTVSHDLRAPLRAISGYSNILKEDYAGKLDPEAVKVADVIIDNATRMGMLIDDLLSFSRLGRSAITRAKIDMSMLVKSVYYEITNEKERGLIDFQVEDLPYANGDINMIKLVWQNLISNAIKFSGNNSSTRIKLSFSNGTYMIEDNGAGFNMKYSESLFKVFRRLHSTREFPGTGVGLAIVHRIISRHGGEIWGEGELDKGAKFFFSLPSPDAGEGKEA